MSRELLGLATLAAAAAAPAGCTGRAEFTLTELNYAQITPEARPLHPFAPRECYYHVDEAGDLYLTMRFRRPALIRALRQEMLISVRLSQASPGVSGNYPLRGSAMLGVLRGGLSEYRFRSHQGIAAVNAHKDGTLTGALRAGVLLVSQGLLGGWDRGRNFHLVGTFTAVPNAERSARIDRECLAGPYGRRVTTRPVTTRAALRVLHKKGAPQKRSG